MEVKFPLEMEKQIIRLAIQRCTEPADYVVQLIEAALNDSANPLTSPLSDDDDEPMTVEKLLEKIKNRTPEEKAAMRERVLKECKPARELPPGISIFDVMPVIRGKETDEEVRKALEELS